MIIFHIFFKGIYAPFFPQLSTIDPQSQDDRRNSDRIVGTDFANRAGLKVIVRMAVYRPSRSLIARRWSVGIGVRTAGSGRAQPARQIQSAVRKQCCRVTGNGMPRARHEVVTDGSDPGGRASRKRLGGIVALEAETRATCRPGRRREEKL